MDLLEVPVFSIDRPPGQTIDGLIEFFTPHNIPKSSPMKIKIAILSI
jgi:hypothetical protein